MLKYLGLYTIVILSLKDRVPDMQTIRECSVWVNLYIINKWQIEWNECIYNKLFEVNPVVN